MEKTIENLKVFMSSANIKNVQNWNDRRDEAKAHFSRELISELDAIGYIKEVLNRK